MKRYKNKSGNSGIAAYQLLDDGIIIQFNDQSQYLYNHASCEKKTIQAMKKLAAEGIGLTTYTNQHVREKFAEKIV